MNWTIEGIDITVNNDGRFEWKQRDSERRSTHETLEGAKSAVKAYVRDAERAAVIKFPPVQVINSAGHACAIEKFHKGNLSPIFKPEPADTNSNTTLYLAEAGVQDLVREKVKLMKRVSEIDEKLRPFTVETPSCYGKCDPQEYTRKVEYFVQKLEKQQAEIARRKGTAPAVAAAS